MIKNQGTVETLGKRHRSPQFPYLSLEECIGLITKFYKKEGNKQVAIQNAVTSMGLSNTSSVSQRSISSLLGYGLFKEKGSGEKKIVWLSDLGKRIVVEKENTKERLSAIQEAVQNDPLFNRLLQQWKEVLPPHESIVGHLQIFEKFNERAAIRYAYVIRKNYEIAQLFEEGQDEQEDELADQTENMGVANKQRDGYMKESDRSIQNQPAYTIPLIGGDIVTITGPFPVNKKNYAHILKWLELMEVALVEEEPNESLPKSVTPIE